MAKTPQISPIGMRDVKDTVSTKTLICVFTAIVDGLPARSRRTIDATLTALLAAGLIKDAETIKVVESLVENPPASIVRSIAAKRIPQTH
jgi:hypothetical protein